MDRPFLKTLIGNRDQSNATSASAYSSRTSEASAFAQAVSDRSALRNLALAFAEDVGPNLVGKLLVSAIVQMIAGLVEVRSGVLIHKLSGTGHTVMILGCASK